MGSKVITKGEGGVLKSVMAKVHYSTCMMCTSAYINMVWVHAELTELKIWLADNGNLY